MATRKKKVTRKSEAAAPNGFRKIESPHISGFWVPEIVGQSIQGVIGDLITSPGKDGKPNVYCQLLLTTNDGGPVIGVDENKRKRKVEVGEGMIVGVGGAVLLNLLRNREGKEVLIQFTGLGPKKPGKNQARLFDAFERE
jgi:hypothetical protein